MAFTINTNIASLQSQEYLRINTEFQQKTINRVTSGLRIVSSGDDAAGLAIANGFRSDRAVLTQGVRNANDGLSTLQTIDGGINNISQLLDRARTLATQSASGTFTGDRAVLNSEFQNVISEIDRQATLIGLDVTGVFKKRLSVFIGGGRGATTAEQIDNGKINVDLSQSNIDTKGLGLSGQRVSGALAPDVDEILQNTTNTSSSAVPGWTEFYFRGPGFSDSDRVRVSVNLNGVDNADKLLIAVNSAIDQAGSGGTPISEAFRKAGVRAKLVTDSNNNTYFTFESSSAPFQVSAGDRLANALLGNHSNTVGSALDYVIEGANNVSNSTVGTAFTQTHAVVIRVQGGSLASAVDVTLDNSTSGSVADVLTELSSKVANDASLLAAGISLTTGTAGQKLTFTSKRGENFEVLAANDEDNLLGIGNGISGADAFDATTITVAGSVANSGSLYISVGGATYTGVTLSGTTATAAVAELNTWIAGNAALERAGLVAQVDSTNYIKISSNNGTSFRLNGAVALGFASAAATSVAAANVGSSYTTPATVNSGGAYATPLLSFSPIQSGGDDQVVTVSIKDSSGVDQAVAITLQADSTPSHGRTLDEAIHYINGQLQASDNEDLKKVVAVKERDPLSGTEKVGFLSPLQDLKVSLGANAGGVGLTYTDSNGDPVQVVSAAKIDGGANIDIFTLANAEAAVNALAGAVTKLGAVQAVVGRGQNQLNFAISIAQTQIINLNASESRIRDADLAAEAANLSKAQVLQQAGIAALAQANSAPQAVLSLLKG